MELMITTVEWVVFLKMWGHPSKVDPTRLSLTLQMTKMATCLLTVIKHASIISVVQVVWCETSSWKVIVIIQQLRRCSEPQNCKEGRKKLIRYLKYLWTPTKCRLAKPYLKSIQPLLNPIWNFNPTNPILLRYIPQKVENPIILV